MTLQNVISPQTKIHQEDEEHEKRRQRLKTCRLGCVVIVVAH